MNGPDFLHASKYAINFGYTANRILYLWFLTFSWRRSVSYRNQSESMDWFLYDRDLRHERVKTLWVHWSLHLSYLMTYVSIMAWPGFKATLLQDSCGYENVMVTLSWKSYFCFVFNMISDNNVFNDIGNDNCRNSSSGNKD